MRFVIIMIFYKELEKYIFLGVITYSLQCPSLLNFAQWVLRCLRILFSMGWNLILLSC